MANRVASDVHDAERSLQAHVAEHKPVWAECRGMMALFDTLRTVDGALHAQLFEIKSCDILQPGPAALTDGVAQLHRIILAWMDSELRGAR